MLPFERSTCPSDAATISKADSAATIVSLPMLLYSKSSSSPLALRTTSVSPQRARILPTVVSACVFTITPWPFTFSHAHAGPMHWDATLAASQPESLPSLGRAAATVAPMAASASATIGSAVLSEVQLATAGRSVVTDFCRVSPSQQRMRSAQNLRHETCARTRAQEAAGEGLECAPSHPSVWEEDGANGNGTHRTIPSPRRAPPPTPHSTDYA